MNKSAIYHQDVPCFDYPSSLEKIRRVFDFDISQIKILDLGCGDGRLAEELIKKGHQVCGLDCCEEGLKIAKQRGVITFKSDLEENLPFKNSFFDLVLLLDTLEHLYDQKNVLKEVGRVLKSNGSLIISYPNHFDLRNRLNILLGRGIIHWAHRKYKETHAWSYGHIRFLLFKELAELLNLCGFYPKIVQFNFMAGGVIPRRATPAFFRKLILKLWSQLLTGKYVLVADKVSGQIEKKIFLPVTPIGM